MVLVIHGLNSSPATYTPLINSLRSHEEIRRHYQFWFYSYPSGYPYPYSAAILRNELDAVQKRFPLKKKMVVIGHSMGGCISRLLVTDVDDKLWLKTFGKPPSEVNVSAENKALLMQSLIFTHRPEVGRVIFVSAPLRGADMASGVAGRIGSRLVRAPGKLLAVGTEAFTLLTPLPEGTLKLNRIPNSVDTLAPNNRFVMNINTFPLTPGIPYNAIVGDRGKGGNKDKTKPCCSDGIVPYWSSYLPGAESELTVPSGHNAHQNPQAIAEVRRILLLHVAGRTCHFIHSCLQIHKKAQRPSFHNAAILTLPPISMKLSTTLLFAFALAAFAQAEPDRTSLPIAEPTVKAITTLDARDAKAPPRFEIKPPAGAPNVVIVLIDDIGFGHSSAFGGPIKMPTLEKLAKSGLRYNRFHTTALCSPTRTALLTGHNHHANNAGAIMELATALPGNTGIRPKEISTLAEILRQNGYSTGAFGKYHETPPWEVSVSGPFDRWPTGSGFDKFYGFIGGETNQWAPAIFDGVARAEPLLSPTYHFTVDMTDKAIQWVSAQQSLTPDKPFYMYFATGATHAPHHAPKEWIEKYKGQFASGWDKLREETFARQKKMGIIPEDTQLTARPREIPAWDGMSAQQKKLFERQMETFAGFAEHTDDQVGRLVSQLEKIGELDNTLFFYIVGDNGSSAEGGPEAPTMR
nr:alpha/beta fold hydrolase [Verrucomicrobium spinosum]